MDEYFDLNEKSKDNFLIYANAVNKARAIPLAEDNLKPIHRKILYTFYLTKLTSDKEPKKSMATVGEVLKLSPHGDAATYGALVRLAQGWKLRYPLVEMQGNMGNLLGDSAAAARYTNAHLSKIGDLMLEDIDKDCVEFVPNYDESMEEPVTLPSKFPFLLCGNNSGIGVSLSSDIVSHNFTEVKGAIEYYLDNKDTCTVADLMKFIQGPDFPTGGKIINGEDLYDIYRTGRGVLKMEPHYEIKKDGKKTLIVFHDLPYGVEIDNGVKAPLKKLLLEEDYKDFDNIDIKKTRTNFFDITISLNPKANVAACLHILLTKTQLADSVKVNNTVIKDGNLVTLNLKQMIEEYVNYRSGIIKRIAQNNYKKVNHKLTITLGLKKCMSDIDTLIHLIRYSDNRYKAKTAIQEKFSLNDEQAEAVLDMKLGKLSKLDITDLNKDEEEQEKTLAALKERIDNEQTRFKVIKEDLAEIKSIVGEDKRLTEICYSSNPTLEEKQNVAAASRKVIYTFIDGRSSEKLESGNTLIAVQKAYKTDDIVLFNSKGEVSKTCVSNPIGATIIGGKKAVSVTADGRIKVSNAAEYHFNGKNPDKAIKLKDADELVYFALVDDDDYLYITNGEEKLLKLSIKDITVSGKSSCGLKCGLTGKIVTACVAKDGYQICTVTPDNKAKLVDTSTIEKDNRTNKGQTCSPVRDMFTLVDDNLYVNPERGDVVVVSKSKFSVKGLSTVGALVSNRRIKKVL
jgi:DNA gyrase/topoisomerase IV subunit A